MSFDFDEMFKDKPGPGDAVKKLSDALMKGDPERAGGAPRAKRGKAARALGHRLSNKTVEYYESLGFMAFRCDYTITIHGGALQSMDLLGIGDVLAMGHGRTILVQSTVAESRTAHERKLCEDSKLLARVHKTVYSLAQDWLAHGGEIEMVSFEKDDKGHWQPNVFNVSADWLFARREKLQARRAA